MAEIEDYFIDEEKTVYAYIKAQKDILFAFAIECIIYILLSLFRINYANQLSSYPSIQLSKYPAIQVTN